MRFRSLDMRRFGTFTDFELPFGEKTGLHLVFGTNGAGKSTTLEALRSVLYGIASKKKVHAPSDLRIGAHIEGANGESLEFCRRTSTKNPLYNKNDDAPIPKEELIPFLGNVDRASFESIFGLDYTTMVAGGSQLLQGKGDLGEALFGARLGGQRLRHVMGRIDSDLGALYKDQSRKGRINELIKDHKSLTADLKKAALRPASHKDDQKRLKAAQAEGEENAKARDEARAKALGLRALRRSAAALAQLESNRAERAGLGQLQPLDEVKAKRVTDFANEGDALSARADERARTIHSLHEVIARTTALASPAVLEEAAAIEALSERRGAYRAAASERVRLQRQLDDARAKRAEAQRHVGPELSSSEADGPEPGRSSLLANLDEVSEALEQQSAQLARHDEARSVALEAVCRAEPKTLAAAERVESIEDFVAAQLSNELMALAPFRGTPQELKALALPTDTELERRGAEEREQASAVQGLAQERQRVETDASHAREALTRIAEAGEGPPPTLAEVSSARQQRDDLIRRVFDANAKEACSALDVSQAVHAADQLADRRARDSVRAAEREAQESALQRATERAQELDTEEAAARSAQTQSTDAWVQKLEAAGLGQGLARMDAASLNAWSVQRTSALRAAQGLRNEAAAGLEHAKAEEAENRARLKAAEAELERSQAAWEQWAKARAIDPAAGPKSAQRHLRLQTNLHAADRDMLRLEEEVNQRGLIATAFEKDAAALCETLQVRPDEASINALLNESAGERNDAAQPQNVALAEARMNALTQALSRARQARSELEQQGKRLAAEDSEGKIAAKRATDLEATLAALSTDAGCTTRDELLNLAARSDKARSLDKDIRRIETELRSEHGDEVSEADLREEIGERTVEELTAAWNDAEAAARTLEATITESAREEGSLRSRVESKGSADAARIQSRLAEVEAELAEATAEFLKVHLADKLLNREIERNRRETHGPLLQRAQELFKVLTLGAYEQLHPSETTSGKEVMVARRPNGRQVSVDEMSSGTRDQLYLALRIATVEHMLKTVEPMPFIADDLFVNFDDERTKAALRVLAELSNSTQVIVFSHHNSVVETALWLTEQGVTVDVLRLETEQAREAARDAEGAALASKKADATA